MYLTQGTKPADWRYQILLIVGTGEGYYSCPAYCDPDTGEIRKAHVFVACLPYSSMIFAWPYPNMG